MPGPGPTSAREPEQARTAGADTAAESPNRPLARGTGPGHPFGPESVPSATGSATVVYWVPGPIPGPVGLRSNLPLIVTMSTVPPASPKRLSATGAAAPRTVPSDLFRLVLQGYD